MTKYTYLLFHKPYNVLCQFTDESALHRERETLKDYIKIPDIYSVGRLDLDSEGLLLLTDNNRVKHRLCDPSFAHPRTYWVQVENIPNQEVLKTLEKGVIIQGKKTKPAQAKLLNPAPSTAPRNPPIRYRQSIPTQWLELSLTEGRNRQVRRMTAKIGYPTLRLIRYSITINPQVKLTLDGLNVGESRTLTEKERRALEQL